MPVKQKPHRIKSKKQLYTKCQKTHGHHPKKIDIYKILMILMTLYLCYIGTLNLFFT